MKRHVVIALMSYSGRPEDEVKDACIAALTKLSVERQWIGAMMKMTGDAMLPHARNSAVSCFRAIPTATDLVVIDDDNYCASDGIVRLFDHEVDVVGAPCRAKTDIEKWPVRWAHRDIEREANGLIEVEGVGTGILRITRACIERMCEAYADRWYVDEHGVDGRTIALFDYSIENHHWWGEDMTFCKRWRDIGGKIFIDPDIVTTHVGKKNYTGSVGDWLRRMSGNWTLHSPEVNREGKVINKLSAEFDAAKEAAE